MTDTPKKIAYLQARWHADIVDQALVGFKDTIDPSYPVEVHDLPGAFELPLMAKKLAARDDVAAVVACAFVVDGGIYRHEFVADAVVAGFMQVQLETGTPVFSVSLTPHHFHETDEHRTFFKEHFVKKGSEAAHAVMQTLAAHQAVD